MHPEAFQFLKSVSEAMPPSARVLEIGSRIVNGSARKAFHAGIGWTGVDLAPGDGVNIVADAVCLGPEHVAAYDAIVCCEVLEHVKDVPSMLLAISRYAVQGGQCYVTCACDPRPPHSGTDGTQVRPGEHYGNVDPLIIVTMLACSFENWTLHRSSGDLYFLGRGRK